MPGREAYGGVSELAQEGVLKTSGRKPDVGSNPTAATMFSLPTANRMRRYCQASHLSRW